jgi:hypothetical protein
MECRNSQIRFVEQFRRWSISGVDISINNIRRVARLSCSNILTHNERREVWKVCCEQRMVCGGAAFDKTEMVKWDCSQGPSDINDILSLICHFDYFPKELNKFPLSKPKKFIQLIFYFVEVCFIVFAIRSVSFVVLDMITDHEKFVTRCEQPKFTLFLHLNRMTRFRRCTVIEPFKGMELSRWITVSRNGQSASSRPRFHFTFCDNSQVMGRKRSGSWMRRSLGA